jgi:predicted deacylase
VQDTRISATVDYERPGKQIGWLNLPYSVTRSAYGNVRIPVCVVANGKGPTVLLMAGNHGDEYEGQIALNKFIRDIDPGRLQGRVIVVPAANLPAALAGTRVSPLDEGNMNRLFPGNPEGTPTEQMVHYYDSVLLAMTQYFGDFHSGGSSLDFMPYCGFNTTPGTAPGLMERCLEAARAVGAPLTVNFGEDLDPRVSSIAALRRGIVKVGGEFGGGGSVSVEGVRLVERGLVNLLAHAGVLDAPAAVAPPTRLLTVPGPEFFVLAPEPGLFEPFVELGETVKAGQPAGQVVFVDNPAREPVPVAFEAGGLVICKRHFGRVERGDCVFHLGVDWDGEFGSGAQRLN